KDVIEERINGNNREIKRLDNHKLGNSRHSKNTYRSDLENEIKQLGFFQDHFSGKTRDEMQIHGFFTLLFLFDFLVHYKLFITTKIIIPPNFQDLFRNNSKKTIITPAILISMFSKTIITDPILRMNEIHKIIKDDKYKPMVTGIVLSEMISQSKYQPLIDYLKQQVIAVSGAERNFVQFKIPPLITIKNTSPTKFL
ncbi:MAG: hypothetical protein HQK51_21930, partial [Oligoflexia bacterium]|nr:hypothetical protein [Oligoflexia bacterium]